MFIPSWSKAMDQGWLIVKFSFDFANRIIYQVFQYFTFPTDLVQNNFVHLLALNYINFNIEGQSRAVRQGWDLLL